MIKKLKQSVEDIKRNKDCEVEYMYFNTMLIRERYEGIQEGIQKGIQEGKLESILEGRLEGRLEGKLEMTIAMIQNNEPIEKIMLYSKMSRSQIEELKNEL